MLADPGFVEAQPLEMRQQLSVPPTSDERGLLDHA